MDTKTKPLRELPNLMRLMKELGEIRTVQELMNRNLGRVDKHFEEVARPKVEKD